MNKKILLSIFCSVMLLVLAGCQQGKLPSGPESPDEESAVPLGMATEALGGAPPCYAPGKVVPAGSFPGVFTVDKETVTLGADGKASVTLTLSEDYILWADLLQKREEGGKQVWTQYKWGSDLHADNTNAGECSKPYKCPPAEQNCVSRKGTYTCWLSGKKYVSPSIPLSRQAPQSNIVKCKDPVSNEVVDAAVFLAYSPKGNKKWLVQVVKVKEAPPAVQPTLTITSPAEGATVTVAQVKVDFTIANPADKKIKAYIGDAAQMPLLESTAISYTTPALPNGERSVKLEVVNQDGSSLSPPVSAARKFTVNVKVALPEAPGGFEEEEAAPQTGLQVTCSASDVKKGKKRCGLENGAPIVARCGATPTVDAKCSANQACVDITGAECIALSTEACSAGKCEGGKLKPCVSGKLTAALIECPPGTSCDAVTSTCKSTLA